MRGGFGLATASTTPPDASAARMSRPLSGTTNRHPSPVRNAIARRSEPTPGSTTARCTPTGRYGIAAASTRAPCPIAWGWMPWVTWITCASGQIRLMTPWQVPAKSSEVPKSDRNVTKGGASRAGMRAPYPRSALRHVHGPAQDDRRAPRRGGQKERGEHEQHLRAAGGGQNPAGADRRGGDDAVLADVPGDGRAGTAGRLGAGQRGG